MNNTQVEDNAPSGSHYLEDNQKVLVSNAYKNTFSLGTLLKTVKENLSGMKFIVLLLVLILVFLLAYPLVSSVEFFREVPIDNWVSFDWLPDEEYYGMLTPLTGSLLLVLITLPLSLLIGWALSLQLVDNRKSWLNPAVVAILEVWISLPSVIIGIWAIIQIIPLVRETFGGHGYSLLAASIGLTIFIVPICTLLFYRSYLSHLDEFQGLEYSFQMSALSRSELFIKSQPTAVIGTINYIFCRIFGETMVVVMVSGNSLQIPHSFLESFRTLTAAIALEMSYAAGLHEKALFAMASIAIVLILIVLLVQYRRLIHV